MSIMKCCSGQISFGLRANWQVVRTDPQKLSLSYSSATPFSLYLIEIKKMMVVGFVVVLVVSTC